LQKDFGILPGREKEGITSELTLKISANSSHKYSVVQKYF
jgi:hypothetical protein